MSKLLLVAVEEMRFHLSQWTFWATLLLVPLAFAAFGTLSWLREAEEVPLPEIETIFNMPTTQISQQVGLVDQAQVVTTIPEELAENVRLYAGQQAAAQALQAGQIDSYYVIAPDYVAEGQITHYSPDPQLLAETDGAIRQVLRLNLLDRLADPALVARLEQPVVLERSGPPPPLLGFLPADFELGGLAIAGLIAFYFVYLINTGGHLLLRAFKREIRARVLEVMIVNTTPAQLMGGKLLGLAALTLLQGVLTIVAGLWAYRQGMDVPVSALPLDALLWSVPYPVLGFLAYCGGIMAVAALWPDFKESTALLGALRLLNLFPLIGVFSILFQPDSLLTLLLSTFPLTSHLLMPFRLLLGPVPGWQWLLGLVALAGWTLFCLWLSVRLFRLHGLLTGRLVSLRLLRQALWS